MVNRDMSLDTVLILKIFRLGNWLYKNKKNIFFIPFYFVVKFFYRFLEIIYGFSMPFSLELGKGVCFKHGLYGIFISSKAVIGKDVIIMHQVTIGSNFNSDKTIVAPYIGNNVFIGPGAKIIGNVRLSDNSKVGANALLINQECEQGIYVSPKAKKI